MRTQRPETMSETDVIALLIHQHSVIQDLFREVERTEGEERRRMWQRLVRLLAVHETAEEEVVHPSARRGLDGGPAIVEDRLKEERAAKELLQRLDGMDPDSDRFLPLLRELRASVLEHARAEERYEFPFLRRSTTPSRLRVLGMAVKAAEAIAPTHPHPGLESVTADVAIGTPIAIMDRARDAVRRVMRTDGG